MLSCFVNDHQNNWDALLPCLAYAYNTSTHATTNHRPYEIMFGRQPKIPLDLVINDDTSQNSVDLPNVDNLSQDVVMVKFYVDELKEKLHEVYKCVAQNRDVKVEKSRIYHDLNIKPVTYEVGDLVLLNKPLIKKGKSKNMAPKWEGPFSIVEKVGQVNYKIKKVGPARPKVKLVHHNRLKRYHGCVPAPINIDLQNKTSPINESRKNLIGNGQSKTKTKRKQVKSRTSKSNGDVGTREVLDGHLPDTLAPKISESADKQTTNVLEDLLESALESADKDEQYEPNHYLRKQTQQLPKGIRKILRNRQPVDRYGYNSKLKSTEPFKLIVNGQTSRELDQFEDLFGEIQWVRMGQNRRFHRTNYAFVRYRDSSVHPQVVRHFNDQGIPHTNIWFEINPRPTEAHHVLQNVPATPRVARQLAEVDRIRNELETQRQQQQQQLELRQQLVESNRQNTVLQDQLSNSNNLVNDLLNTEQRTVRNRIEFVQPPRSPSLRARHNRDPLGARRPIWQQQAPHRVER
ncbi:Retrovirus-related Pol poly from transposon [Brachionus plicatilis]|uniref:Retrovirus-related Pol poly from transposon n=1 Tax=Brachionus plicatilis TaxID=10195 RepID=A0A3M7QNJ6_BRAPC|nr:Retrovirus-related Pol poly from transposon [Brachionus plicatilis]